MRNKRVLILVTILMLIPFTTSYAGGTKVMVNDHYLQEHVVNNNGRVLLPFRAIFNALGVDNDNISWDGKTKTVKAVKDDINIELSINSKTALVNGKKYNLDQPARLIDSKTMVPVRFVAETFNIPIDWHQETQSVLINSEKPVVKKKQKVSYPNGQKSINGKSYEYRHSSFYPELFNPDSDGDLIVERDLKTDKITPVYDLVQDNVNLFKWYVGHVDNNIWYVQTETKAKGKDIANLVVYNPENKKVVKKQLVPEDLIKDSSLINIQKTIDKLDKKIGGNSKLYFQAIEGGVAAHTEDYVYMHFNMHFGLSNGKNSDEFSTGAIARVRKKDLFIDFISEFKTNHIMSEELISNFNFLDYHKVDEYYYYLKDTTTNSIYRVAHNDYKLEKIK